jgi:hypothetical protein
MGAGGSGGSPPDPLEGCDIVGIELGEQKAGYWPYEQNRYTWLEAYSPTDPEDDDLYITLHYTKGASDQPHTHAFSMADVDFRHTHVLIKKDGRFLSVGGSITVTENGVSSGTLSGTLNDVRLIEVLYDEGQINPYSVKPGGRTWCIPSLSFSAEITL